MDFVLVMYCVYSHLMLPIFLFSGAKLGKKEIERDLIQSAFFIILTI